MGNIIIKILIKEISNSKNISAHFIIYANNSGQIQELFSQKLDKSQASLKQIKNIIKFSSFKLSIKNNAKPYLNFDAFFHEEKLKKPINYENLIELRGRAMLTKKLGNDQLLEEKAYNNAKKKIQSIHKAKRMEKKIN